MAFSCQMNDGLRLEVAEGVVDRCAVADIRNLAAIVGMARDGFEGIEVGGIGELVDIQHVGADIGDKVPA
jgi:hypothetical protein